MGLKFWATMPFFYGDMDRPWRELVAEQIDIAQAADELGFEGVIVPENHFQNYLNNPSSIAMSAVIAAKTKRLRIQPGVIVLPYFHPLLVASDIGLLEALAPGRVSVSFARGGSRLQFDRIGVPYEEARGRYEESLEIIKRAWVEDDLEYDGVYYSFPKTTVTTRSQNPLDIWIAAQSIEGITKVAEQGHNLITSPNWGHFEPHGDLDTLLATYNRIIEESGHTRGQVMVMRHVWVGDTEEQAIAESFDAVVNHSDHYMTIVKGGGENRNRSKAERLTRRVDGEMDNDIIVGGKIVPTRHERSSENLFENFNDPVITTADRMIQRFKHFEEIGIDHLTIHQAWGQPIDSVIANMEKLAKEVFPAFAEQPATVGEDV
jgi:alkanesulfonate monooxygenase SsuD/methylene tetrahydromethanopterin reductase-like flavin-dependent oxidoreductase (luciferase family)